MAFTPNKEQQDFIDTKNVSVLVSASAGSGKTTTMVHKLIDIICKDRVSIQDLLIVTYTNASASEMKQKVYNAILEKIRETTDEDLLEFLYNELENVNVADIGTLHSVCKKILSKYFYKIDQNPSFRLIIDKERDYLFTTTIDKVIKRHIIDLKDEFYVLYENFSQKRNMSVLYGVVNKIYTFLITKPNYESWVEKMYNTCYTDLDNNVCARYILDYYKDVLTYEKKVLFEYQIQSEVCGVEKFSTYIKNLIAFIDEFMLCADYISACKLVSNYTMPSKPSVSEKSSIDLIDFDDTFAPINKSFKDFYNLELKTFFSSASEEELNKEILDTKSTLNTLINIVYEVMNVYAIAKKNLGVLDFNDLEHKTYTLLLDEELQKELQDSYKYVFVDEYQDINEMQECIISRLSTPTNLNMIGDVKQSIYGFRLSTPKIFIDKYNEFKSKSTNNIAIDLNYNYRSEKSILEFVNFVCDTVITLDTIGIDYKSTARLETEKKDIKPVVRLSVIDKDKGEDDENESNLDATDTEAYLVLKEIDYIMHHYKVTTKDGVVRPYQYEDIAILVRSKTDLVRSIIDVLSLHQIPVNVSVNSEFFDTYEVSLIVSILKTIVNYKDDVALVSVLKSFMFNLTEDDLVAIRLHSPKAKFFYEAVESYKDVDNIIGNTVNKFFDFVTKYREYLYDHSIYDLLCRVFSEYDLICHFKSMPDGDIKEINIQEFLNLSNSDSYKYDIHKFLNYLRFIDKDKYAQDRGNGKGVSIYTIHYSKGLEYPAVILAGLGTKFNINKDTNNVIINDSYGIGIKSTSVDTRETTNTLIVDACKIANKKSEIDEEIRLFYVAMTRARDVLSLVGRYSLSTVIKSNLSGVYSSKNYLDLVFKAVAKPDLQHFVNKSKEFKINLGKPSECLCYTYSSQDIVEDAINKSDSVMLAKVDNDTTKTINNLLIDVDKPSIAIKSNVTKMLSEETTDYESTISVPKKLDGFDTLDSVDALTLGTAYHNTMQSVKYNENREEIYSLVDDLYNKGIIPKGVVVDKEEVYSAVKIVGKLVAGSKSIYKEKQFIFRDKHCNLVKGSSIQDYVIIQGVIDLIIVTSAGAIIIDFKTNKSSEKFLKEHYKLQLDLYAKAYEKANNIPVIKKYLYSFKLSKLIEID